MTHHALTAPATLALAAVGSYTYVSSSIICSSSGTGITLTARRVLWLCFRSLHHPHFAYAYVVSVSCNRPSALAPLFVVFAMFSLCMSGCKSCQRNCNNILVCGSCSLSFRPPCVNNIAKNWSTTHSPKYFDTHKSSFLPRVARLLSRLILIFIAPDPKA